MVHREITGDIVRAAIKVHTVLGPGMLESAYRKCLCHELILRGRKVEAEVALPISYNGIVIDAGYRIDLLVDDRVLVELKSVTRLQPVHRAQLLSYLRMSGRRVGILINFNVTRLMDGLKRIVN